MSIVQQRRAFESQEDRQARLEWQRLYNKQRRATETQLERQACSEQHRQYQQGTRATETQDDRQARLEQDRERYGEQRTCHSLDQKAVHSKKFHTRIAELQFVKFSVCEENFPGLNVESVSSSTSTNTDMCACCQNDRRIPKLCSSDNNMNPGPVPPELQLQYHAMNCGRRAFSLLRYIQLLKLSLCHHSLSSIHTVSATYFSVHQNPRYI